MNQNHGEFHDPKGQGLPPPYTEGAPPQVTTTVHSYPTAPPAGFVYQANIVSPVIPVVIGSQMGPKASAITCRSCNHDIVTRVEYKPSTKTHLFALLLCLLCWPCTCLPYCIDSCQNADHYCPNCNAYIGSYTS